MLSGMGMWAINAPLHRTENAPSRYFVIRAFLLLSNALQCVAAEIFANCTRTKRYLSETVPERSRGLVPHLTHKLNPHQTQRLLLIVAIEIFFRGADFVSFRLHEVLHDFLLLVFVELLIDEVLNVELGSR